MNTIDLVRTIEDAVTKTQFVLVLDGHGYCFPIESAAVEWATNNQKNKSWRVYEVALTLNGFKLASEKPPEKS